MRVAVLVKQIPAIDGLDMRDGRLIRDGVELEVNAYCRRANAKAIELAGSDGEAVVITMGPPSADDALREMLACGATRAIHLCDPAFAGADTIATARALAAAVRSQGEFDLVLCGLNSLDADTGQVGPEVAELLGLPFAAGARELEISGRSFQAVLESDNGRRTVRGELPVVLSTAERLCEPSKAAPELRLAVSAEQITCLTAADLEISPNEVGALGSPTRVRGVRLVESHRRQLVVETVADAVAALVDSGALEARTELSLDGVPNSSGGTGPEVWALAESGMPAATSSLVGEAAVLAKDLSGRVTAIVPTECDAQLSCLGADSALFYPVGTEPEQLAAALAALAAEREPWAFLVEGTRTGRTLAARIAARNGWGLIGDAVGFEIAGDGRLVGLKPTLGGAMLAEIDSRSSVQMATVRPSMLRPRTPRPPTHIDHNGLPIETAPRIVTRYDEPADEGYYDLLTAEAVIGVGRGVAPNDYRELEPLRQALGGAAVAATRKVTDSGWLPRSRQVGVTGHAISPRLYIALGITGKLNHMIGVRNAGTVLAVNVDPRAPVFMHSDVGLVGDWRELVGPLAAAIAAHYDTGDEPPLVRNP